MAIEFVCSNCGKTLRVPNEHLGKKARCPACQSINLIQPAGYPANAQNLNSEESGSTSPSGDSENPAVHVADSKLNPYASTTHPSSRLHAVPHRGGLVLTLGIVAFCCNFFFLPGILAWVFGNSDLKQMKAGLMDREGETMTTIGMVLGIISVVFPLLAILFYVVFVIFVILAHVLT